MRSLLSISIRKNISIGIYKDNLLSTRKNESLNEDNVRLVWDPKSGLCLRFFLHRKLGSVHFTTPDRF